MENDVYLADSILTDSIVDGPGLRAVIWFQGCAHNCTGCHNPNTHKFNVGLKMKVKEICEFIDELENQDGITLSGGDPFYQPEAMLEILKYIKSKKINVWVYTGFTFDKLILSGNLYEEILSYIDVLVDGKFDITRKSLNSKYRGSNNQEVIDCKKSLSEGKKVLFYED